MTFKKDMEPAHAGTSTLSAIGMIALMCGFAASPVVSLAMPLRQDDTIRVRVSQIRTDEFNLTGQDISIGRMNAQGFHAYKLKKFTKKSGVTWSITDRDTHELVATSTEPTLQISGEMLRLNLKPVPNSIEILSRTSAGTSTKPGAGTKAGITSTPGADVVADLDLETYLKGVLPAEMPASWPIEALKAQAIAARTFALFRKAHSNHEGFDLDSDVTDQMFVNPLRENQKLTANADRAILETKGVTLEDHRHQMIAAYFHADCGGHTEEAEDVWGTGEKLGTATDAGCPLNPKASWTLKLTTAQLAHRLKAKHARSDLQLIELQFNSRTPSGRIAEISTTWSDGSTTTLQGNAFRQALGFDQLKSTQFTAFRIGDAFIFKGQGYGHGVGLCQWGARQMARAGHSYKEILAHYYPRARLTEKVSAELIARSR